MGLCENIVAQKFTFGISEVGKDLKTKGPLRRSSTMGSPFCAKPKNQPTLKKGGRVLPPIDD